MENRNDVLLIIIVFVDLVINDTRDNPKFSSLFRRWSFFSMNPLKRTGPPQENPDPKRRRVDEMSDFDAILESQTAFMSNTGALNNKALLRQQHIRDLIVLLKEARASRLCKM